MTEIALAWLLTKVTAPVVGATKLSHVEGAAKATELELTREEAAYLEGIRHSERQLYLVAEAEGEIIGTGVLSCGGRPRLAHRGEISISVKKAMWGQHIATRMLEEILRFAWEQAKVRILSLEVRSDNARAIGLYRKFGFETVGRFPGFLQIDGEEVSCDLMRLHL